MVRITSASAGLGPGEELEYAEPEEDQPEDDPQDVDAAPPESVGDSISLVEQCIDGGLPVAIDVTNSLAKPPAGS